MKKGMMTPESVKSTIASLDESTNNCYGPSSPVYGTRKTADAAHNSRSSAGSEKESGFMMAPNSKKGPRR